MRIIVTGSAGFIGSAIAMRLLARGDAVLGIDNHNSYYDPKLKEARAQRLVAHSNYEHLRLDLTDARQTQALFARFQPQVVVHMAAQAGVRYSITDPQAYVNSNLVGFANVLEACRHCAVEHLVYASTSSVYGANLSMPFATSTNVDHPLSLYAATKKANELMAHSYSHLYQLPTTGLRFFTVYGPWGRPDMALFKFTKAMLAGEKIPIFNYGKHKRDFSYIDDVSAALMLVIDQQARSSPNWNGTDPDPATSNAPWRVYNIGNGQPVNLLEYVAALEQCLGLEAQKEFLESQPGDMPDTFADTSAFSERFHFRAQTSVRDGVAKFVEWYRDYYQC